MVMGMGERHMGRLQRLHAYMFTRLHVYNVYSILSTFITI